MGQPFPEEFNRKAISLVADLNFTTTEIAKQNLLTENIIETKCFYVGNTIVDAFNHITNKFQLTNNNNKNTILITCHRRENWGTSLIHLCESIIRLSKKHKNYKFVFCVHLNPKVHNTVTNILCNTDCTIISALPYNEFIKLLLSSYIIITDSGGIQEEAGIIGTPTLVYRNVTERPEGLNVCLKLIGNSIQLLEYEINKLINDKVYYSSLNNKVDCYGNGTASSKIIDIIKERYKEI